MKTKTSFRLSPFILSLIAGGLNLVRAQGVPFTVAFLYPNGRPSFPAPANIGLDPLVLDSNLVETVQYFAGTTSLGTVTNTKGIWLTNRASVNPFFLLWSNVPAGDYTLSAVATDSAGIMATSPPVIFSVFKLTPPTIPFIVKFLYPTSGQTFPAPADIGVHAFVLDSNLVETVQYFAGTTSIGIVTNTKGIWLTNTASTNPFFLLWSNVPAGDYTLSAVATDSAGILATSPPVTISVIPFIVKFLYPTNGQTFPAPADIGVHAFVLDSNLVETVQYFAGATSIGTVTNTKGIWLTNTASTNPFFLLWSNVPAGDYTLSAVATDSAGIMATSPPVTISVVKPTPPSIPFIVKFLYPTSGQTFLAPANIGVHAFVLDSNLVETVQYFAGTTSIGTVTNTKGIWLTNTASANPFFLLWSNVPPGDYTLAAVATDSAGIMATSPPVTIYVVTNLPPLVRIYAPDPVAVEGTNLWFSGTPFGKYYGVTNTATFVVWRDGQTNADLTIDYSISGTATNGLDYATIGDSVTIPAGRRYSPITIVPLNDSDSAFRQYDTVILSLTAPSAAQPPYRVGWPGKAGAVILEENILPFLHPLIHSLADNSIHVSLPATNGMSFSLQTSTDMVNWVPVCTNVVLKGSAQFVDPDGAANPNLFYRIVPLTASPAVSVAPGAEPSARTAPQR